MPPVSTLDVDDVPAATVAAGTPVIVTLGCRLNIAESEVMKAHALSAGLGNTVIINTCAVTGDAVRRATQTIRKLRREHPDARLIVTGCAAQIEPERFAEMSEVDHVIGNAEKMRAETFHALAVGSSERVQVDDIMSVRETASHLIDGFNGSRTDGTRTDGRTRAFVQVQNGCDHRCTFCIIPYGRGPSRSVPAGEVVTQVRRLVEAGTREVVLTGVDMTSYGPDLPGDMTLGKLVRSILKHVPDLPRLRLSSIDQVEADAALLDVLATEARLMPHLHLSLQSGDDMILKRMKRRHVRADAISFCKMARDLRPDIVFGADLIAGFPTETDTMFARSRDIIDDCSLTYLHVFPFSPRHGTPAARMPQVRSDIAKARAAELRALGARRLSAYLDTQIGALADVLVEKGGIGRTAQFTAVQHAGRPGTIVPTRIVGRTADQLIGEAIP